MEATSYVGPARLGNSGAPGAKRPVSDSGGMFHCGVGRLVGINANEQRVLRLSRRMEGWRKKAESSKESARGRHDLDSGRGAKSPNCSTEFRRVWPWCGVCCYLFLPLRRPQSSELWSSLCRSPAGLSRAMPLLSLSPRLFSMQTPLPGPESDVSSEDAPHDAYEFWNGFFDSVNIGSPEYQKGARAGTAGLADPAAETQYLHYKADAKQLRYATDIAQNELLDHDGDVTVGIQLSKFRPGSGVDKTKNQQLRIDATQTHAYMNLLAPLAWTAIASLKPNSRRQNISGRARLQVRSGSERHQ